MDSIKTTGKQVCGITGIVFHLSNAHPYIQKMEFPFGWFWFLVSGLKLILGTSDIY